MSYQTFQAIYPTSRGTVSIWILEKVRNGSFDFNIPYKYFVPDASGTLLNQFSMRPTGNLLGVIVFLNRTTHHNLVHRQFILRWLWLTWNHILKLWWSGTQLDNSRTHAFTTGRKLRSHCWTSYIFVITWYGSMFWYCAEVMQNWTSKEHKHLVLVMHQLSLSLTYISMEERVNNLIRRHS